MFYNFVSVKQKTVFYAINKVTKELEIMAILTDFHTHSYFSGDCDTPMEDMIIKAISLGMTHLCFTEHLDLDYPVREEESLDFDLNTPVYREEFLTLKNKYKKDLCLLWGVELGLQNHIYSPLHEYVTGNPFDFVIASSHLCGSSDPYYPDFFEGKNEEEIYGEYFTSILENVQNFSDYDVYGHLDYIVRYGPTKDARYSYEKYRDIFDPILKTIIENGKGIEVNTGGIKYGLKNLHPTTSILKRYKELGGEIITIGSDAHKPENLLHHFSRAKAVLEECDFKYYTIFQERKPTFLPL